MKTLKYITMFNLMGCPAYILGRILKDQQNLSISEYKNTNKALFSL